MINVEKREHPVWQDWKRIQETNPEILTTHRYKSIIGQYQYIYQSKKGTISLVELPNYFMDGIDWWEIMQMNDDTDLVDDIERFRSKEEAEVRIKELLD